MSYLMDDDVKSLLKRIRILKAKSPLSITDSKELTKLQGELAEIQDKCRHVFGAVLLFHKHSQFCLCCDKENYDYIHQD